MLLCCMVSGEHERKSQLCLVLVGRLSFFFIEWWWFFCACHCIEKDKMWKNVNFLLKTSIFHVIIAIKWQWAEISILMQLHLYFIYFLASPSIIKPVDQWRLSMSNNTKLSANQNAETPQTPSAQPVRSRAQFQSVDILWLGLSWLCCGDVTNTKSVSPPTTSIYRSLWIVIILWKLSPFCNLCLRICE